MSGDRSRQRLIYGLHPVQEVLRAGQPLTEIVVSQNRLDTPALAEIGALAQTAGVALRHATAGELDNLASDGVHQGVVAFGPPLKTFTLDEALTRAFDGPLPPLFVALDSVTDPQNVGSIARSAEVFGANGIILPSRRTAPVTAVAEKAAAGAFAHLPVIVVGNMVQALAELAKAGVWSLGLAGEATVELATHPLVGEPAVLVVGAEGRGLSPLIEKRVDGLVRLPMHGQVGSLNAAVAAAIGLYTLRGHASKR